MIETRTSRLTKSPTSGEAGEAISLSRKRSFVGHLAAASGINGLAVLELCPETARARPAVEAQIKHAGVLCLAPTVAAFTVAD